MNKQILIVILFFLSGAYSYGSAELLNDQPVRAAYNKVPSYAFYLPNGLLSKNIQEAKENFYQAQKQYSDNLNKYWETLSNVENMDVPYVNFPCPCTERNFALAYSQACERKGDLCDEIRQKNKTSKALPSQNEPPTVSLNENPIVENQDSKNEIMSNSSKDDGQSRASLNFVEAIRAFMKLNPQVTQTAYDQFCNKLFEDFWQNTCSYPLEFCHVSFPMLSEPETYWTILIRETLRKKWHSNKQIPVNLELQDKKRAPTKPFSQTILNLEILNHDGLSNPHLIIYSLDHYYRDKNENFVNKFQELFFALLERHSNKEHYDFTKDTKALLLYLLYLYATNKPLLLLETAKKEINTLVTNFFEKNADHKKIVPELLYAIDCAFNIIATKEKNIALVLEEIKTEGTRGILHLPAHPNYFYKARRLSEGYKKLRNLAQPISLGSLSYYTLSLRKTAQSIFKKFMNQLKIIKGSLS